MNRALKLMITGVLFIFFIAIAALVYKDDIEVKSVVKEPIELVEADILSLGKEIIINSIAKNPDEIYWIDNENVVFKSDLYNYKFNIVDKELTENTATNKTEESDVLLLEDGGRLKFVDGKFIYVDVDQNEFLITDSVKLKSDLKYTINQAGKKVAYYNSEKERIVIYNYSKNKFKVINRPVNQILIDKFSESALFSPQGGYIILANKYDDVSKNTFAIFGTDSGSTYAEEVMGYSPMWSPDKTLNVIYKYTVNLTDIDSNSDNDFGYIPSRIGAFDIRNKRINYIGVNIDEINPYGELKWIDKILYFFNVSMVDEGMFLNGLTAYDFDKSTFVNQSLGEPISLSLIKELDFIKYNNDILVNIIENEHKLIFINEQGIKKTINIIDPILEEQYYKICDEGIIIKKNNQLVIDTFNSLNEIYRLDGEVINFDVNDSNNRIILVENIDDRTKIVITQY